MFCGLNPGRKHGKPTASKKLRGLLRKKNKKKIGRKQSGNLIPLGGLHLMGLGL